MSEPDQVLGLLDDLMKLLADSPASTIEVEADGFAVTVTRRGGVITSGPDAAITVRPAVSKDAASIAPKTQRVHAGTVGIFNGPKAWSPGDFCRTARIRIPHIRPTIPAMSTAAPRPTALPVTCSRPRQRRRRARRSASQGSAIAS